MVTLNINGRDLQVDVVDRGVRGAGVSLGDVLEGDRGGLDSAACFTGVDVSPAPE